MPLLLLLLLVHIITAVPIGCELIGATLPDAVEREPNAESFTVLVLGSDGLIGSALVTELRRRGYDVLEAKNRVHLDLRVNGSLRVFDNNAIHFCFFLACEVGKSAFLTSSSNGVAISQHNLAMYDNVLPYLEQRKIPFLFASSQLAVTATAYGRVKAMGEKLVAASAHGKFLRFWDVYGTERIASKWHIVADWIYQCVKFGYVASHANGLEKHQFVHANDMALGLVDLMLNFESLPKRVDITSGEWITMRQLATMIQQHSKHGCDFKFSELSSSTMILIEPENLWQVPSSSAKLHKRIQEMLFYYEGVIVRQAYPQHSQPYLSIIMCTTNDNYNDIRSRTFNSITTLAASAEAAHLSYELIVVQYNPQISTAYWDDNFFLSDPMSDRDLPFSQLFPWLSPNSFGNLRVVTVPSFLHPWPDKGKLWEYIGKNAGAVRARGKFLLFTNPDNVFPLSMIEQLSKQQLEDDKVYLAGIISNFTSVPNLQSLAKSCNDLSEVITAPQPRVASGQCLHVKATALQMTQMADAGYDKSDGLYPSLNYLMIGDFSIFPRHLFLNSSGYLEMPQNTHVESGHIHYLSEMGTACQRLDGYVCHQGHSREGRPDAPVSWTKFPARHLRRNDSLTFGMQLHDLPQAYMHNIFSSAYNPEDPFNMYQHHPLFSLFKKALGQGELQEDFVLDFLGIRTNYSFDCADLEGYRYLRLSRRIPCARHEEFFRRKYNESVRQILGDLPVVDEEYFGWISLLSAVSRHLHHPVSKPFVVIELGARYGTWAVRGGAAMRTLQPRRPLRIMAVEVNETRFQWLQSHVQKNELSAVTRIVRGRVATTAPEAEVKELDYGSGAITNRTSFTLAELLAEYEQIDIIHCEVQLSEQSFVGVMPLLASKVKALHFETHDDSKHDTIKNKFIQNGWTITLDINGNQGNQTGRIEDTAFGPVRILRGGILAVENTALIKKLGS